MKTFAAPSVRGLVRALALTVAALTSACHTPTSVVDTPDAPASPQASAMPAPLAVAPAPSATPAGALLTDSGPPPVVMRGDQPLAADAVAREGAGYTLSAVFRRADAPAPPRAPEVNAAGVEAARKKTELRLAIDLTAARLRLALVGHGFVLPPDTEIRARADHYGHVVVWPDGASYRPLPPGAMRALLGERRFDVAPIATAKVSFEDETGKRIGIKTHRVDVTTRAAKATLDVGHLPDLGEGGVLLCRLLLDLMNAPPQTAVCATDELPLRAELKWTAMGSFGFEVTGVLKKTDMATAGLAVPPTGAAFAQAPFPVAGVSPMLSPQELAAFRSGPVEVPSGPVTEGLLVANHTDELRVLEVDGVPAVWAAPGAHDVVRGLVRGRYVTQWRTFLGDSVEPAVVQIVPGSAQLGGVDGGVR
jgi:hypothetical protein